MKLTGILVEDDKSKTVLAYIHQFPGVMVEGKNYDDAKLKLDKAWENFVKAMQITKAIDYNEAI